MWKQTSTRGIFISMITDRAKEHIANVVAETYPGSAFNYAGDNVQSDAPLINSEYGGISAGGRG